MVLTDTFIDDMEAQIATTIADFFDFMAFGTDNTTPERADTALGTQIGSNPTEPGTVIPDSVTIDGPIYSTDANSEDLVEIGFDDTALATDLKRRALINTISKRSHKRYLIESFNFIEITQS